MIHKPTREHTRLNWARHWKGIAEEQARQTLCEHGYNYALSDVEEACAVLNHPELTPDDESNYHKWAQPYPRRCYCSMVGYTEAGRVYACDLSDREEIMKQIFPGWENTFGRRYP